MAPSQASFSPEWDNWDSMRTQSYVLPANSSNLSGLSFTDQLNSEDLDDSIYK